MSTRLGALLIALVALPTQLAQAVGPQDPVDSDNSLARVYVYRTRNPYYRSPTIYCDDIEVAHTQNNRYFTLVLKPGRHVIRDKNKKDMGTVIDAKAGQEYFIRLDLVHVGMNAYVFKLAQVPEESGRFDMQSLKPLDQDHVKTRSGIVSLSPIGEAQFTAGPVSPKAEGRASGSSGGGGIVGNEDVVRLKAAGFSDELLITTIRNSSSCRFQLDPDSLIRLKEQLSEPVIRAMLEKSNGR